MKDGHRHCPCNGVWLCNTCHRDVHDNPFESRETGFIVSRSIAEPGTVTVDAHYGTVLLLCDGWYTHEIHTVNGEM